MIRSLGYEFPIWRDERLLLQVAALVVAVGVGVIIATQPLTTSILLLGVLSLVGLSFITPLLPIIALLIIAPLRTLVATETSINLPLDPGQLMVVFVAGTWAIWHIAIQRNTLRFVWSPLLLPIGLFVVATGASILNAVSIGTWLTEWLKWVLILLTVMFILILSVKSRWEWLVFGLVCAGVVNALVGIYIFLGGSGATHLLINNRFFRAFGTFGQPNPFGGFMGILAPIAIMMGVGYAQIIFANWWQNKRSDLVNVIWMGFYAAAACLLIIGVFVSWSRGAWLGFGMSALVLIVALPRRPVVALGTFAVAVVIGGIIWTSGLLPQSITARLSSATEEAFVLTDVRAVDITSVNFAIVERLAHWQAAYNMAESNFWLGVGFGNYEVAYAQYQLINWDEPLGHAHNYYLNIFGEAGLIGLSAYILLLVGILWFAWRASHHPDPLAHALSVGIIGSWVYLMAHSLTDNLYVNNMFLHLGVMLGIIAVLHNETRAVKVTQI